MEGGRARTGRRDPGGCAQESVESCRFFRWKPKTGLVRKGTVGSAGVGGVGGALDRSDRKLRFDRRHRLPLWTFQFSGFLFLPALSPLRPEAPVAPVCDGLAGLARLSLPTVDPYRAGEEERVGGICEPCRGPRPDPLRQPDPRDSGGEVLTLAGGGGMRLEWLQTRRSTLLPRIPPSLFPGPCALTSARPPQPSHDRSTRGFEE